LISDVPDGPRDRRARRARAFAPALAALGIAAITFGGCGGGGSEGSSTSSSTSAPTSTSAQGEASTTSSTTSTGSNFTIKRAPGTTVRGAVDAVLVSGDPEKACGDGYVTRHYLEAAYGGEEGCVQAQRPGSAADSLGSYQAKANGNQAMVTVRPSGGLYNGEKITVALVQEGGSWKVDALKSNAPVGP
jgi:hypothetical protein